jgi:hypothetical protein
VPFYREDVALDLRGRRVGATDFITRGRWTPGLHLRKTNGIFTVNHHFFPCNDKIAINDVQGSLVSLQVTRAAERERQNVRNNGSARSEELEVLRLARLNANC